MRTIIRRILIVAVVALAGLLLHEAGHGLVAMLLGGRITAFQVIPGVQLYPALEWRGPDLNVAWIAFELPGGTPWQFGLIALMGGGTTALLGALAGLALWALRPRGPARDWLLAAAALLPLDLLAYSVFPVFGLRHWIVIGGARPEPAIGAQGMGITPAAYYVGLAVTAVVYYTLLARLLKSWVLRET
jgi:hypothetical protein